MQLIQVRGHTRQTGQERATKTSWDWLKIGSNGASWQPTFLKKTAPGDGDDDDEDDDPINHQASAV